MLSKLDLGGYCLILYAVMTIFLSGFVISAIAQQQADKLSQDKHHRPIPISIVKGDLSVMKRDHVPHKSTGFTDRCVFFLKAI